MLNTFSLRETKAARWRGLLAEQSRSGLSIPSFCETRRIKLSTFRYWKSRFADQVQGRSSQFISVSRSDVRLSSPRVLLPNGVVIDLNAGLDDPSVGGFLKSLCGVNGGPHARP